ncbi:MAG: hypothetical protein ACYC6R_17915 [Anaerolineales bacterium]
MTTKKGILLLILMWITLVSCARNSSTVPTVLKTKPARVEPVHVSIVLHFEENFIQNKQYFLKQRRDLLELAVFLSNNGLKLNLQPDWAFMQAIHDFEDERMRQSTNGKNILRYLAEDLGHEVDPHAHEHRYNYADVAYLIQEAGVVPSHIAGGMIADPPQDSVYDHLAGPIRASQFDFSWQAQWLWGDATANHVNDTAAAGVWRPKDANHFYENDDAAPIPCIGKYTKDIEGIYDLIMRAEAGETEPNRMLTAAIFIGQGNVSEMSQQIASELDKLKGYETEGKLVFASLSNVTDIWLKEYDGRGYLFVQP